MQYRDQNTHSKGYFTGVFDPTLDEIDVSFDELTGLAATVTDAARETCGSPSATTPAMRSWFSGR